MCTAVQSIYVLYANSDENADGSAGFEIPPAYQEPPPFGVNIGGANPAFVRAAPDSEWDSWLTIGITTGDVHDDLSSIGIKWDHWSATQALSVNDGAVFWMDSASGPTFLDEAETAEVPPGIPVRHTSDICVGQLTLDQLGSCHFGARGRSHDLQSGDWDQPRIEFVSYGMFSHPAFDHWADHQ